MSWSQRPSGLIVDARLAAPEGAPELREIATTLDGRDITRGYISALGLIPSTDPVQAARGGRLDLYDPVKQDDQVKTCMQQRLDAVISTEWEVEPGDSSRRSKKAADSLKAQLDAIRWDDVCRKMLWGVFWGYSVAECLYERDGSEVTLADIRVRDRRRFGFGPDFNLKLQTNTAPMGETLPPAKFWHFAVGADHDDEPYGLGLASWLYWPVYFKRHGLKVWFRYLDKFSMPTLKGTYPSGTQDAERRKLLEAMRAMSTDSAVAIPEGMMIELLEAARSGSADYTSLHDRMNAAIAKVVLGQTMTTDQGSSRSQGEVHLQVRQDILKADADVLSQSFNSTVAAWLTHWNFGPDTPVPMVWRRVEEGDDLDKLAERDERLFKIGFVPSLERVKETYGEGYELTKPEAESLLRLPPMPADDVPVFASPETSITELQATALELAADEALTAMLTPVRRLVENAQSLEEIRDGLFTLYPDMDATAFASVLRDALVAANLAGRFDAR